MRMATNCIQPTQPLPQQLYEEAAVYKHDGNELYKNKDFKKAMRKYHYALLHLRDIGQSKSTMLNTMFMGDTGRNSSAMNNMLPQLTQAVAALTCDCYNNLAACLLKEDEANYEKIVTYCDKVIEIQASNSKALYRRGLALYNLHSYDKALDSLEMAKSHCKKPDPSISKYITRCKEKTKILDEKLKKTYQNMMSEMIGK